MTKNSVWFEKRIHRIHQLLEGSGAQIIWNDRLPDPDNPRQARQIDITIRRNNRLTLVECRLHNTVQDVKWIEELIGRRISLHADAVIAVSSSGYSTGAIKKAEAHGIILRDFQTLTREEVQAWGQSTRITLTFFEYQSVSIKILMTLETDGPPNDAILHHLHHSGMLFQLFQKASDVIDKKVVTEKQINFTVHLKMNALKIGEAAIDEVEISAAVRRIQQAVDTPSVVAYDVPNTNAAQRTTIVEELALGDSEITHSSNNVCIAADLGAVSPPPNSLFMYIGADFGRDVTVKSFELLRLPPMSIALENPQILFGVRRRI